MHIHVHVVQNIYCMIHFQLFEKGAIWKTYNRKPSHFMLQHSIYYIHI